MVEGEGQNEQIPPELANLYQYRIVQELGSGGMGRVFLAKDLPLDRDVVIKIVNTNRVQRAETLERFAREMRVAAKLHHPNVVTAYTSHQVGDLLVFVMEHVSGIDLSKYVKSHGKISPVKVAFYANQVARGLKHAHEHNLVHRDIKPSNLMLLKHGKKHIVKILDFGLAKAWSECGKVTNLTGAGCMLGTPEYVAPEQIRDAAHADIRADLYSLGCTMYFLLIGEPPFRGRSEFELQEAHVFKKAPSLSLVRPEVPQALSDIVAKLLAKSPDDRYQTPAELVAALSDLLKMQTNPGLYSTDDDSSLPALVRKPATAAVTKTGLTTTEMPEVQTSPKQAVRQPGPQEVPMLPRTLAKTPPAMNSLKKEELFPAQTSPKRTANPRPSAAPFIAYGIASTMLAAYLVAGWLVTYPSAIAGLQAFAVAAVFASFVSREQTRARSGSWWVGTLSLAVLAGLLSRSVLPSVASSSLLLGWLLVTVTLLAGLAVWRIVTRRR
jgi:serine/threonine protein kinase